MPDVEGFLSQRKRETEDRVRRLSESLRPAQSFVGDFSTVYATGSVARGEVSSHSDLDVFILTDVAVDKPLLGGLETIRLQSAVIEAAEREKFPPFTDGGRFLAPHLLLDLTKKLGGPDDDYENLFTARMLLLLESRPLLGLNCYERALDTVLDEYWRDFEQNEETFLPVYLTNDLIRYWKVLCLNYEQRTRDSGSPNKRRLVNYKLKHSRLLTCYSALLYFCHILGTQKSITKANAKQMSRLTPIERLKSVGETGDRSSLVSDIL